ncbi:FadR/GntR family transcriptional regulator [Streptomyces sp. NPDC088746]|uniref:FadR/GntR family transcriptional regulator n=1 Tax=Streptomyces sp. NPDC088746 TaxID=3365885 RepID=UPI0037FFC2A7
MGTDTNHRKPMAPVGAAIRAPKMAELIASRLRSRIVRRELGEGDALPPETELMQQFGVSRPTLREAFRILEAESLISIRRGARGGAQVMAPDLGVAARYVGLLLQVDQVTIGDVYEARIVIEPAAAAMLARRRTPEDVDDLRACVERLRDMVEETAGTGQEDPVAWSMATQEFHDLILERAGNRTLMMQAGMLREVIGSHLALTVSRLFDPVRSTSEFRKMIRSYTKLVDLVAVSDADGAEEHWRKHMQVSAAHLLPGEQGNAVVDLFD